MLLNREELVVDHKRLNTILDLIIQIEVIQSSRPVNWTITKQILGLKQTIIAQIRNITTQIKEANGEESKSN